MRATSITHNERDGDVTVCAQLDSPAGGIEKVIMVQLASSNGERSKLHEVSFHGNIALCMLNYNSLDDFTFPSNSQVGDTQCLMIEVADNMYEPSPATITVTLSKREGQNRLDLSDTVTTVTVIDDDGELAPTKHRGHNITC